MPREPAEGLPHPLPAPPELRLCAPPYHACPPLALVGTGIEPPWGSAVCATGQSVLAMLELLAHALERWPWISPAVALPVTEQATFPSAPFAEALTGRLATVAGGDPGSSVTPRQIVSAVALRPAATPRALAGWASTRLNARGLLEPLEEQFSYALGDRPSLSRDSASYSRLFTPVSQFTARDWRAVARLVRALHTAAREKVAPRAESSTSTIPGSKRSVRRYVRRYLDMTWATAATLVGWEWILECALTHRGRGS